VGGRFRRRLGWRAGTDRGAVRRGVGAWELAGPAVEREPLGRPAVR
jgi:hypothetical protein